MSVAVDVFHRNGYDAASVQEVADGLGMLKGSLYYYIKTKEDLLFAVVEQIHADSGKIIERVAAEPDLDPLARLAHYVREEVLFMLANQKRFAIYYNEYHRLTGERLDVVLSGRKRHIDFIESMIVDAQTRNEVDPVTDLKVASHTVSGVLAWPHRWWDEKSGPEPTIVADLCAQFAIRGLGADK